MKTTDLDAPLTRVRALYLDGRYLDAFEAGRALGDLRAWPGTGGRILASRLAGRLGASRVAQALVVRAWRDDRGDPEALWYHAGLIVGRRGAWHGLRWLRAHAAPDVVAPRAADFAAFEGVCLAHLRDFDRVRARLDEARRLDPASPWVRVEAAAALELEDRVDEALEATAEALSLRAHYHPALRLRAHLLAQRDRREEAVALLDGAPHAAQSFELLGMRAEMARSLGGYGRCVDDLTQARAAAVHADPRVCEGVAGGLSEALYLLRRYREAAAAAEPLAKGVLGGFVEALRALADGAAPPRVELTGVPHIRQDHVTCAPASVAQIAAYLGDPVDHVALAETVCYAGTPAHRLRAWAEGRGFAVAEFDVTLEAARGLIDRGLPFMLITASTVGSHAQVVVGYDLARGTLLLHDPSHPYLVENLVAPLLASQAWCGPCGVAFVPASRAGALDGLALPERGSWDARHRFEVALERHDVAAAEAALADVEAASPGGRHALQLGLELARYRGDGEGQLRRLDALLALHPHTRVWVIRRAEVMRGLRPRAERLAFRATYAGIDDPALLDVFAEELRVEESGQAEAGRLLRRSLRVHPAGAARVGAGAARRAARGGGGDARGPRRGARLRLGAAAPLRLARGARRPRRLRRGGGSPRGDDPQ